MARKDTQSQIKIDAGVGESEMAKAARAAGAPITGLNDEELRRAMINAGAILTTTTFPKGAGLETGWLSPTLGASTSQLSFTTSGEVAQISSRLAKIEQGLNEVKEAQVKDQGSVRPLLDDLIKKTADAKGETDNLAGRLLLPPQWLTDQQLVPVTLLERLEEYRSDENILLLLAGTFGGAILGVLSSWFVAEATAIARGSVLFLGLLVAATVLCGYGAYRVRQRSKGVKSRMFGQSSSAIQMGAGAAEEAPAG